MKSTAAKPRYVTRLVLVLLLGSISMTGVSRVEAQNAPTAQSSDVAVRQYRDAAALHNRQVYDLAADEWGKFLAKFPTDPLAAKAQYFQGVCLLELKKYEEARAALEAVVAKDPKFEQLESALLSLGLADFSLGQAGQAGAYDKAAEALGQLIERFPAGKSVSEALYYRGEALAAAGKRDAAIQSWSQLVEKYPNDPQRADTLYALGVTLEENGKAAEAGKIYDQFLKEFPKHASAAEVGLRKGETLLATGQVAQAEKLFAAAAAAPEFALADHATMRLAATLYEQQKFADAAAAYASVPQKFPKSTALDKARLNAGICYFRAGRNAEARPWLEQASGVGAIGAEAAHWLARSWLKDAKPGEALKVVQAALAKAGDTPSTANLLLDQADAVYEIPERRKDAALLYAALARRFPQDPLAPQAMYLAAFTALGQADYAKALEYTQAYAKLPRANEQETAADVTYVAAECQLHLDKPAEADALYRQLLDKYSQHADTEKWRVRRAVALQLQQKHAELAAYVPSILAQLKSPDAVAEAQYLLGASQLELGRTADAVKSLSAALAAQPKWRQADETRLALARAQMLSGDQKTASQTLNELLDARPDEPLSARAYLLRAAARQQAGQYTAAVEDLERFLKSALAKGNLKSEALYLRGMCEARMARYADAVTTFRSILAENPKYPEADKVLFELAWALTTDGQQQAAADTFVRLAREYPSSPLAAESLYRVGEFRYHDQKDYAGAVAAYADALKRAGKSELGEQAAHKLGWAYYQQDDFPAAQKTFAVQLADYSGGKLAADGLFMEAETLFKQNRFAEAAELYGKALARQLSTKDFQTLALLHAGQCASQTKQWNDAVALLERCARDNPNTPYLPEIRFELAWAKQNLGQTAEALQLYEQVAEQSGQLVGARARFNVAELYLAQRNPTEAIRHYFKVAYGYGYPNSPPAYREWQANATYMAAFCCAATDKKEQARKLFAEVIANYPQSDKATLAKQKLAELEK